MFAFVFSFCFELSAQETVSSINKLLSTKNITQLFNTERVNFFADRGVGRLKVPIDENDSDSTEKGICYNIEAGINVMAF